MLDFQPAREFLSLDDQRAKLPIYDLEPIDEPPEPRRGSFEGKGEGHMDLGGTEKETACITDFNLLKVIGKGSFGKVSLTSSTYRVAVLLTYLRGVYIHVCTSHIL